VRELHTRHQSPTPSGDKEEIASLRKDLTSLQSEMKTEMRDLHKLQLAVSEKASLNLLGSRAMAEEIASLATEVKGHHAHAESPALADSGEIASLRREMASLAAEVKKSRSNERVGRPSRPTTPPTRPPPPAATKGPMSPPPTQSRATKGKRRHSATEPTETTDRESQPSPKGKRTRNASPTRGLGLSRHAEKDRPASPQPSTTPPPASNRGWTKAGAKGQDGKDPTWAQIVAQPWAGQRSVVVILGGGGEGRKPRRRSKRKRERPDEPQPRPDKPGEPVSLW